MPRATVQQQTQIGIEGAATPGTPVDAVILLPSTSFSTGVRAEVSAYRPIGQKYVTMSALQREWTECGIGGIPSYNDLLFLLAGIVCTPTSAEIVASTGAYTHEFALNRAAPDTITTYTVEQGDPSTYASGNIAQKWAYGLIAELGLEWRRTAEPSVSGRMIGQALEAMAETMSTATIEPDAVPILPGEVSVYLDTAGGTIGTTKLTEVSRLSWRLANRFSPRWTLNAAEPSFSRQTELAPELTATLLMDADSGMDYLGNLREGTSLLLRVTAESPQLANTSGTPAPFSLQIDMACKVTGVSDFQDDEGVYAMEYTLTGTPELSDGGTGYEPLQITLINNQSSFVPA